MATEAKPMSKSQVINALAEKLDMPRKDVANFIDVYHGMAISETKKVGTFVFPGIGKMVKAKRKARIGRNPATGEPVKIPAKTVVKMRLSKSVKEAIA